MFVYKFSSCFVLCYVTVLQLLRLCWLRTSERANEQNTTATFTEIQPSFFVLFSSRLYIVLCLPLLILLFKFLFLFFFFALLLHSTVTTTTTTTEQNLENSSSRTRGHPSINCSFLFLPFFPLSRSTMNIVTTKKQTPKWTHKY